MGKEIFSKGTEKAENKKQHIPDIKIYNKDFTTQAYPVGLTVTDSPYNQDCKYNTYVDKLSETDYTWLLSHVKPPCVLIHYPEETINLFHKIWGKCEEVIAWVYPSNTGKMFRLISFIGCKPNFRKMGQPYRNPTDKRVMKLIEQGKEARLYDWWEINQVNNTQKEKLGIDHPCVIPEELIERIIRITAEPEQLIIDPFAGSGTTLVVAKKLGFNAVGYEIDKKYASGIKKRLAKVEPFILDPCCGSGSFLKYGIDKEVA
jgi:hypothetical protein